MTTQQTAAERTDEQILVNAVAMCPLGIDGSALNSFLQAALGKTHAEAGALIRRGLDRGTIKVGRGLCFFVGDAA